MRKLHSLKSLGSSDAGGNSPHPSPPSSNEKLDNSLPNIPVSEEVQDNSQTTEDASIKALNQYPEKDDSSRLHLRRSRSLSSCATNSGFRDGNLISGNGICRPTSSCGGSPNHASSSQMHYQPLALESFARSKSCEQPPSQHPNAVHKQDSPSSLRNPEASVNSPSCSPIPLRYSTARLSRFLKRNGSLDQYIDGEDQEVKPDTRCEKCLSESGIDCSLSESRNRAGPCLGRSPEVQSTARSSLLYSKEHARNYSFREAKDSFRYLSAQNWIRDDCGTASGLRHIEKSNKRPLHAFHGLTVNSRDFDSESTTTFEDNYMDSTEMMPTFHSDDIFQHCSTDCKPSCRKSNGYFAQELLGLEKYSSFLDNRTMDNDYELQGIDEELVQKLKDVEKMIELLPEEDFDLEELKDRDLDVHSLFRAVRNIKEDRKYLALELSSQMKCRLAERCAGKRHLKQARIELKSRTRRLEREKSDLRFRLEQEFDRRSSDWSLKLEMIQLEEQRLREQLGELVEQNVSLQREIASIKSSEGDKQNGSANSEMELSNLTASLEQLGSENNNLQKALSELQEHSSATEKERDCIKRYFSDKESETKELQKLVVRFQRTCDEQERTISSLRQAYSDEIEKESTERDDQLSKLQMEQLRLTGIEQNLRKELKTYQHELETLRQENVGLLTRVQAAGNGSNFSSVKLEQELHTRVDCLQTEGLSLLNDISRFNDDLLELLRHIQSGHGQEAKNHTVRYPVVEYAIRKQSLSRRCEKLRTSLETITTILDDKSDSSASQGGIIKKSEGDELEIKLREEIMLTRLLREKLYSNELELDRLEADLASSIRVHDVLKTEIQRMQDEISSLTHKTTDMEIKMLWKEQTIRRLEHDYQECTKELTAARNTVLKVTEERNHMWEEVKSSREKIMLLSYELVSLQKKIEQLDEDILTKEGQISILRDSLAKPFDLICSPRSVKDFSVE